MKIAISSVGRSTKDLMDTRFGRCNFFHIYDTENDETYCIENKGQFSSQGAGIQCSQQVIDENVEAVVTGHVGPNAYKTLDDSDVAMYAGEEIAVEEVIKKFNNKELKQIMKPGQSHKGLKK